MIHYSERVIKCIQKLAINEKVDVEDKLVELGIDSLGMVELLITLEDEFNIEFHSSLLNPDQLVTVANIIELVNQYLLQAE